MSPHLGPEMREALRRRANRCPEEEVQDEPATLAHRPRIVRSTTHRCLPSPEP
jgi:hypothetical protein